MQLWKALKAFPAWRLAVPICRLGMVIREAQPPRPSNHQTPTGNAFTWRLASYYAAFFAALGVQVPFLPVWFAAKGLDASLIGMVLALPMLVRVFAIPATARIADAYDALRPVIIVGSAAAALGYGLLAFAQGTAAIIAVYALASAFYTPLMPLADAYALRGLVRERYGPVRLWGSAAFIVATLGGGVLLDAIAPPDLVWLVVATVIATAAGAYALARLPMQPPATRHVAHAPPYRNAALLGIAVAAGLVQASHAVYYGFSTIAWKAAGLSGLSIGTLWAIGVLAEIALFACSARWAGSSMQLLVAGAAGGTLRWGVMALDPPAFTLPVLQCLHGLSFGATHLGSIGAVARLAPAQSGATAQGFLAVIIGLLMAACMAVSGALYAELHAKAYAVMSLIAALGGAVCYATMRRTGPRMGG
jgi:MFS transporter, PPP family, 3-phenylpropionic acid transporter